MTGGVVASPFFVIATLFLSLPHFFYHCDAFIVIATLLLSLRAFFIVIASEARQSRWRCGIASAPECLAMTGGVVASPFIVIATLLLSLRRFYCHCDTFIVIATPYCHCERSAAISVAVWDCFGTRVPRNLIKGKGGFAAALCTT